MLVVLLVYTYQPQYWIFKRKCLNGAVNTVMQDCAASSNNIHKVLVFVNAAEKAFSQFVVAYSWKKLTQEDNTRHNATITPSHFCLAWPGKGLVSTA